MDQSKKTMAVEYTNQLNRDHCSVPQLSPRLQMPTPHWKIKIVLAWRIQVESAACYGPLHIGLTLWHVKRCVRYSGSSSVAGRVGDPVVISRSAVWVQPASRGRSLSVAVNTPVSHREPWVRFPRLGNLLRATWTADRRNTFEGAFFWFSWCETWIVPGQLIIWGNGMRWAICHKKRRKVPMVDREQLKTLKQLIQWNGPASKKPQTH